jgi:hypothetical protein
MHALLLSLEVGPYYNLDTRIEPTVILLGPHYYLAGTRMGGSRDKRLLAVHVR